LFFSSEKLNVDGMVIDFGEVKDKLNDYIDSWDHAMILSDKDNLAKGIFPKDMKVKFVPYNPTAENMAEAMYYYIKDEIPELSKVRLHETATGYAEYSE